jgi:hypothetical protein
MKDADKKIWAVIRSKGMSGKPRIAKTVDSMNKTEVYFS